MLDFELIKEIAVTSSTKMVLLVIDGLGGLPHPESGKTELETARTPNLDMLSSKSICGLSQPVSSGITPGSGPGHLALFGYDPVKFTVGRGVLETVGIDFNIEGDDIAARGNFCSIDEDGNITDRRAGRISNEKNEELCRLLNGQDIEGIEVIIRPVREHRFIAIFRGKGLSEKVTDSDPQRTGIPPREVTTIHPEAEKMAHIANKFMERSRKILAAQYPANMILLRGFSKYPDFPSLEDIYKVKAAAIASYPMYRGLAKLVGMHILGTKARIEDEFTTLKENYGHYDFFFVHIKGTDSAGEDGDFDRKVKIIEETDSQLPIILNLNPDVLVITGDHSTPAVLKNHSWHPVPVMLYSKWCRPDAVSAFSESACLSGGMGHIPATELMPLAMANALKLSKFGA